MCPSFFGEWLENAHKLLPKIRTAYAHSLLAFIFVIHGRKTAGGKGCVQLHGILCASIADSSFQDMRTGSDWFPQTIKLVKCYKKDAVLHALFVQNQYSTNFQKMQVKYLRYTSFLLGSKGAPVGERPFGL